MDNYNNHVNKTIHDEPEKFPIELKKMTVQETKEYHLKRLLQLSKKWSDT